MFFLLLKNINFRNDFYNCGCNFWEAGDPLFFSHLLRLILLFYFFKLISKTFSQQKISLNKCFFLNKYIYVLLSRHFFLFFTLLTHCFYKLQIELLFMLQKCIKCPIKTSANHNHILIFYVFQTALKHFFYKVFFQIFAFYL